MDGGTFYAVMLVGTVVYAAVVNFLFDKHLARLAARLMPTTPRALLVWGGWTAVQVAFVLWALNTWGFGLDARKLTMTVIYALLTAPWWFLALPFGGPSSSLKVEQLDEGARGMTLSLMQAGLPRRQAALTAGVMLLGSIIQMPAFFTLLIIAKP